jgi:hypothetical protein
MNVGDCKILYLVNENAKDKSMGTIMNARNPIMNGPTNTYPDTLGLSSHWPNVLFLFGEVFSLLIFPLLLPFL